MAYVSFSFDVVQACFQGAGNTLDLIKIHLTHFHFDQQKQETHTSCFFFFCRPSRRDET